jgi:hypothetical protein
MYIDSIVDEVHRVRHDLLAQYGGDMNAYNAALSQTSFPGFKIVHLEPATPFAWNHGQRPSRLNARMGA